MAKLNESWCIALLIAFATGCGANDPRAEGLGTEEQAAESAYDKRVLAAFELNFYDLAGLPVVVACDDQHRLMYTFRVVGGMQLQLGWQPWIEVPSGGGCIGAPTVAKRLNKYGRDSVSIYGRFDDGHLWEAYMPDPAPDMGQGEVYWYDISVASGIDALGPITDSPMLADSGDADADEVSVVVKIGTGLKSVYTVDKANGAWRYRKVYAFGSTAVKTEYSVSTRGHLAPGHYAQIAGRGYAAGTTEEGTGWFARRIGFNSAYTRVAALDAPGVAGTPAPLFPADSGAFDEVEYARFGSSLKARNVTAGGGWQPFSNCYPAGMPRITTMPYGNGSLVGFIRGGETASVTSELLLFVGGGGSCSSVGGALYSGPTPIEYAQYPYNFSNAAYKGPNNEVYFYNADAGQHERVPGITLP